MPLKRETKPCVQNLRDARQVWYSKQKQEQYDSGNATSFADKRRRELYDVLYNAQCPGFSSLVDQLNELHDEGKNIVVSDEQLSFASESYSFVWNILQEILGHQWNFSVLLGYRRWMDFLPSRKWQNDLNKRV